MNLTPLRAGLALVGTAAVLVPGAMLASAATHAPAPSPSQVSASGDAAAQGRAAVTSLVECVDDRRVQQPETFTLACADDNQRLENLTWTRWGHEEARATGVVRENVSTPLSKGDRWISYPVTVTASGLVDGEASATYTTLTVTADDTAPTGVPHVQVVDLPGVEPLDGQAGEEDADPGVIDHLRGWSDGHEGMDGGPGDGHEGMDGGQGDGHEGMDG